MFCKSYNDFFQTLANPTNQAVIQALLVKPMNVTQIVQRTKLEQSKASHSLKRLWECKVVNVEKKGKERIYGLNKDTIIPILQIVDKHAQKMCPRCLKIELKAKS